MKILIAEDEKELCSLLALVIKTKFNAEVLVTGTGQEAIEQIRQNPDLAFVLSDYAMPLGNGGEVFKYLVSIQSKIPFILCSSNSPEDLPEFSGGSIAAYIQKPFAMKQLCELLLPFAESAQRSQSKVKKSHSEDFIQINSSILLKLHVQDCDLFLELPEKKMVKMRLKGATFSDEDRERLHSNGIENLYLRRGDSDRLLDKFADHLLALVMSKGSVEQSSVLKISETAYELAQQVLLQLNISEKAEQIIQAAVDLTLKTIHRDSDLSQLLDELFIDQENYISSHSVVLAYVACGIAAIMKLNDEATCQKLVFAAFLHDITLKNQSLAQFQTLNESVMLNHGFSKGEVFGFSVHPNYASALAAKFIGDHKEVATIIAQHHERPDGSGFPNQLSSSNIDLLSSIFIVAHELVTFLNQAGNKPGVDGFLVRANPGFQLGHFQNIIAAMKSSPVVLP